jgi:hypothetical protein
MERTKLEVDVLTGETRERPYTDEENAQADIDEQIQSEPMI